MEGKYSRILFFMALLESYLFLLQSWQVLGTTYSKKGILFPEAWAVKIYWNHIVANIGFK